ncbi:uncharacterized protein BYT42DRAFT_322208 [Radiomyces spectabilis]|uniref:uncharacterized protein n=1 Tax=Radiomyces spectabilis TaxID=64574 RepID=UPI00222125B0|nr:uncharacterized protein BYT42DRAFT_322208 [Radiomyces spectabilis]KAI8379306.1 hypothetical protein BYT42DRAFT_322208 [Radiomyces spectabilis]
MASLQELAHQQIASLFAHNTIVTSVVDGQLYDLPCDDTVSLLINLPPRFPDEPPVITVTPTGLRHPWIDADTVMNETLRHWNHQQMNIGQIAADIRDEFAQRPPTKKDEGYGHRPPPPIPTSTTSTPNLSQTPLAMSSFTPNQEYTMIMNKTSAEVEELLSNDLPFEMFFNSLERVKGLKTVQEELMNGNENLAHKNLSREDQLAKLRTDVMNLNDEYRQEKHAFDEKERLQQEAYSRFSSSTVLTRLKASVYESDDLSESVAQSFLDGNLDHDSFVKQFRELRKVYHLRASKLEKAQTNSVFT